MTLQGWVKVFSTPQIFRAEMVKHTLLWHDIGAVIVNKIDSSYNNFGECEVYVAAKHQQEAQKIIAHEIQFEA